MVKWGRKTAPVLTPEQKRARDALDAQRQREKAGEALAKERAAAKDPGQWGIASDVNALPANADLRRDRDGHLARPTQLDLLLRAGDLTYHQHQAGKRYGELIARILPIRIRSCCNDDVRGFADPAAHKALQDQDERAGAWEALQHDARKITLLDKVCYADESLHHVSRGDKKQKAILKTRLVAALDDLTIFYGMVRQSAA